MNSAVICNFGGTTLILVAVIIHIVCLTTPNYSSANLSNMRNDPEKKKLTPQEVEELMMIVNASITVNYGLWKMCFVNKFVPKGKCQKWDNHLSLGDWLKGAQAMAILGVLVLAFSAVLAVINLVVQSKGDRLRLLPFFIAGICFTGSLIAFIGDIVVAVNFDMVDKMPGGKPSPPVENIMERQFGLSWAFALDIVAVVLGFVGGFTHVFARYRGEAMGLV